MDLEIIILAAGKGTRMRSRLPKVLQPLAGMTLLEHVVNTAKSMHPETMSVVYGHGGDLVPNHLSHMEAINWIEQVEQLGTGHAVMQAHPHLQADSIVLVLYGDVPLTQVTTLNRLLENFQQSDTAISLLTATLDDPSGYGRIIRDQNNQVTAIVEEKDATSDQKIICEVNTGILAAKASLLAGWLAQLDTNNAQGELYLTDIIRMAVADGKQVQTASAEHDWEILGVNDKLQLSNLERQFQLNQAHALMRAGVTLRDPHRFDNRGNLSVGQDVLIDVNVVIEGNVSLGNGTTVGANTSLTDVQVADGVTIKANCVIEDAVIGQDCVIGPFARIRPGTELKAAVHIGNFVEIKKSKVDNNSKINHLSYVGDATVGQRVNIGAGTITCNYDGANKNTTIIEDDVFVGSDSQLIAPVTIKQGATIAAGTTVNKTAPAGELTIGRCPQEVIKGWQRPIKRK